MLLVKYVIPAHTGSTYRPPPPLVSATLLLYGLKLLSFRTGGCLGGLALPLPLAPSAPRYGDRLGPRDPSLDEFLLFRSFVRCGGGGAALAGLPRAGGEGERETERERERLVPRDRGGGVRDRERDTERPRPLFCLRGGERDRE